MRKPDTRKHMRVVDALRSIGYIVAPGSVGARVCLLVIIAPAKAARHGA